MIMRVGVFMRMHMFVFMCSFHNYTSFHMDIEFICYFNKLQYQGQDIKILLDKNTEFS